MPCHESSQAVQSVKGRVRLGAQGDEAQSCSEERAARVEHTLTLRLRPNSTSTPMARALTLFVAR